MPVFLGRLLFFEMSFTLLFEVKFGIGEFAGGEARVRRF
jgi:hypothetical protein